MENTTFIKETINAGTAPVTVIYPKNANTKLPVVFLYHGWSSSVKNYENLGILLSSHGYFVVIPEPLNHDTRGTIDYWAKENTVRYFWPTISNSIREFPSICNYIEKNYPSDMQRLGISGHSMGGITTSGLLATYKNIKAAVTMDGSGSWKELTLNLLDINEEESNPEMLQELNKLEMLSPSNHIDNFMDTPLLILHGESDAVVPIKSDYEFFNMVKAKYNKKENVAMITFDRLNHYITQAYINEAVTWFNLHL